MMEGDIAATSECKHLNFVVRGYDRQGFAHCPDCLKQIWLADCFQNLADEMRKVLAEFKKEKEDG